MTYSYLLEQQALDFPGTLPGHTEPLQAPDDLYGFSKVPLLLKWLEAQANV